MDTVDSTGLLSRVSARPSGNASHVVRLNTQVTTATGENVAVDGQTQFFRYNALMLRIIRHFMDQPADRPLRFLFAPCSVGCEPYSFVSLAQDAGFFNKHPRTQIDALDICPDFVAIARNGQYTPDFFQWMSLKQASLLLPEPMSLRHIFTPQASGKLITLPEAIRERVHFLAPQGLADFRPTAPYDFVMNTNLLIYLNGDGLHASTQNLARICDGILATTYSRAVQYSQGNVNFVSDEEHKPARFALAQAGFVKVAEERLTPVFDTPAHQRIPGIYANHSRGRYNAVLLHSSDVRPASGFAPLDPVKRLFRTTPAAA